MSLPLVAVNRPLLVTVRGPPFVVVIEPPLVKLLPVRMIPEEAFVSRLPLRVDVPVPASCVMEAAVMSCTERLLTLVTVKTARRGEPTLPAKVMSPLPAVKVRLNAPPTVLEIV